MEINMNAIMILKDVIEFMGMEFLYFPEDKSEYIPALIVLAIFIIGAVIAMYLFIKHSKKEEKKVEEQYRETIDKGED